MSQASADSDSDQQDRRRHTMQLGGGDLAGTAKTRGWVRAEGRAVALLPGHGCLRVSTMVQSSWSDHVRRGRGADAGDGDVW